MLSFLPISAWSEVTAFGSTSAPLTGESVPADKTTDPSEADVQLAERRDMLYKGTSIADGEATGATVATGAQTELGRISRLAEEAESTTTPLQKRLEALGRRLAWLTVAIAIFVALVGYLVRQEQAALVIETALALGIAAIPEGLPIVATIALARGMYLMAKRNALVNKLTAVETLGATRVIFIDRGVDLTLAASADSVSQRAHGCVSSFGLGCRAGKRVGDEAASARSR